MVIKADLRQTTMITHLRNTWLWALLLAAAALLAYVGFRGYLTPELLFMFANHLTC